jgi:hypothetical protein
MATSTKTEKLLSSVLREVKSLRRDIDLIVPSESLENYKHPARILASFRRATKKYAHRA